MCVPIWLKTATTRHYKALNAAPYVQSGSDDMCVRTDENPKVFVPCGFRRTGANARGETRKNSKKRPLQMSGGHKTVLSAPEEV